MSNLSTLPKGDSAWLLRKAIERIMQQISVLETNIGSSTTGNSANTQVIFNDNGTLRGDPDLTFNTSLNKLVANNIETAAGLAVGTSATITGDLTVHTSTLKVDSANNRVGIGTATPGAGYSLDILGAAVGGIRVSSNNYPNLVIDSANSNGALIYIQESGTTQARIGHLTTVTGLEFSGNNGAAATNVHYGIDSTGISTWKNVGGVAGTAMTLNTTGLGIGGSAIGTKLEAITSSSGSLGGTATVTNSAATAIGNAASFNFRTNNNFLLVGYFGARIEAVTPLASNNTDLVFYNYKGVTASGDETMRITSSGNVGIGVTPKAWATLAPALQIGSAGAFFASQGSTEGVYIGSNAAYYGGAFNYVVNGSASYYRQQGGVHSWFYASSGTANNALSGTTQAMTLDASGILIVGNTAAANVGATGGVLNAPNSGNSYTLIGHNSGSASGSVYSYFFYNSAQIGSITQNGTTGVLYNTSSDYRLKESVKPISGGLARVNALKPSIYKWKSDGSTGEGFLAHELAEVVPFAVSGDKDAVNADGTIKSQGVDMSRIVPILVAAIQELASEVNALKNA